MNDELTLEHYEQSFGIERIFLVQKVCFLVFITSEIIEVPDNLISENVAALKSKLEQKAKFPVGE